MIVRKISVVGVIVGVSLIIVGILLFSHSLIQSPPREVVIYTSVDQIYAEPVLREFENSTGIHVLPVYDVEAAKTTGLVNRLIAEKGNPRADVFWSGEIIQTMLLGQEGVLAQYYSSSAADIPAQYRSPDGFWTGFGGRARVILVNTKRLGNMTPPRSLDDFANERYPAVSVGIAYPMFGTAATHAAALYAARGNSSTRAFFEQIRNRGIRVVDGNSVVRDLVAQGQLTFGLTDTDDACGAVERGDPVILIFPDQEEGGTGTLIIPNTVAVIARGPHPAEARILVDYLLSRETEEQLIGSGWIQVPVRATGISSPCVQAAQIRGMNVTYTAVYPYFSTATRDLREIFIR